MATTIEKIITSWSIRAVIFDLDGTLVDNNPFHLKSWLQYLENIGRHITQEEFNRHLNGRTNKDAVEYIYGRKMDDAEAMVYTLEKETIYRQLYRPFIKPVNGLLALLPILEQQQLPMAIATSGIQVNIDFMFEHIPIRQYFTIIVNSAHIKKGKPDPEIYLTTARQLNIPSGNCLVFEDAVVGVNAAKAAGMKAIAVTTTQTREELAAADLVIRDFSELLEDQ
jgi:beta-phosphoglucomutase family hydrolase